MKSFGQWFAAQGESEDADVIEEVESEGPLPEGVYMGIGGKLHAFCRACARAYTVYPLEVEGFEQEMSYCGASPRCCP